MHLYMYSTVYEFYTVILSSNIGVFEPFPLTIYRSKDRRNCKAMNHLN